MRRKKKPFDGLLKTIGDERFVYIQTHNVPDADAVASAYGLQYLLKKCGIASRLIYEGEIQTNTVHRMIRELAIDIRHNSRYPIKARDKIIIVDACKGNRNVTDLIGDEIAVIDHHQVSKSDDVPFNDIRPEYGSCSSIIFSYFNELGLRVPSRVATALLVGLNVDTNLLTRGVHIKDVETYYLLFPKADFGHVNSILRNYYSLDDLDSFRYVIDHLRIHKELAYCYLDKGCPQNLLGIMGDFILSLREVDFVVLCSKNDGRVFFSLRNERSEWNAALIIQEILKGIGSGGGHADMAGGVMNASSRFDQEEMFERFIAALNL